MVILCVATLQTHHLLVPRQMNSTCIYLLLEIGLQRREIVALLAFYSSPKLVLRPLVCRPY